MKRLLLILSAALLLLTGCSGNAAWRELHAECKKAEEVTLAPDPEQPEEGTLRMTAEPKGALNIEYRLSSRQDGTLQSSFVLCVTLAPGKKDATITAERHLSTTLAGQTVEITEEFSGHFAQKELTRSPTITLDSYRREQGKTVTDNVEAADTAILSTHLADAVEILPTLIWQVCPNLTLADLGL